MSFKERLKDLSVTIFSLGQRLGVNITPDHYYIPISNIHVLNKTRAFWAKPSQLVGVDMKLERQVDYLIKTVTPYQLEFMGNENYIFASRNHFGPGYGYIEAQALHGFIRGIKPRRIIEVGSGVSTYCMLKALKLNYSNEGTECKLTCIEPYPRQFLREAEIELHEEFVERIDPAFFDQLDDGDLLFIDSSHVVKVGSDVLFLYLEVIPRLKKGVYIHIHDIYIPYNYQRDILTTYMQWCETSLLQALLVNNNRLQVLMCLSFLHYFAKEHMKTVFPEYDPLEDVNGLEVQRPSQSDVRRGHFPASVYLQIV